MDGLIPFLCDLGCTGGRVEDLIPLKESGIAASNPLEGYQESKPKGISKFLRSTGGRHPSPVEMPGSPLNCRRHARCYRYLWRVRCNEHRDIRVCGSGRVRDVEKAAGRSGSRIALSGCRARGLYCGLLLRIAVPPARRLPFYGRRLDLRAPRLHRPQGWHDAFSRADLPMRGEGLSLHGCLHLWRECRLGRSACFSGISASGSAAGSGDQVRRMDSTADHAASLAMRCAMEPAIPRKSLLDNLGEGRYAFLDCLS
jgi:hypothetical protein